MIEAVVAAACAHLCQCTKLRRPVPPIRAMYDDQLVSCQGSGDVCSTGEEA